MVPIHRDRDPVLDKGLGRAVADAGDGGRGIDDAPR